MRSTASSDELLMRDAAGHLARGRHVTPQHRGSQQANPEIRPVIMKIVNGTGATS